MLLSTNFLNIIVGIGFALCEGKQCYLSSCLHNDGVKWILPKENGICQEVTLGGHGSRCPNDDSVFLLDKPSLLSAGDKPYLLSAGDELHNILSTSTWPSTTVEQYSRSGYTSEETKLSQALLATTQNPKETTCPPNMVFGNCTGVATCEDPTGQNRGYFNNCVNSTGCVCPNEYLMKEGLCVPYNECGCFLSDIGTVITKDGFYVNRNCSRRCECRDNELVCENNYRCSDYAICEERNNVRQCYCPDSLVGDGQNCTLPIDCLDIFKSGYNESGIYTIMPITVLGSPFEVYCNMSIGGGWTVFQRRVNGSVDFYLDWKDYTQGFGFLDHEFWLGNDKIYTLTSQADYELRIDLVDSLGSPYYATYDFFRIANEDENYKLTDLGMFNGTAGYDAMATHRGQAFTTRDRDNDVNSNRNCAQFRHGAWWYKDCQHSNLNGGYFKNGKTGIWWKDLTEVGANIKYTEMKIRPMPGK